MPPRLWGGLVSVVVLAAVAWPLTRDPEREDSFPLSTYPMFAFRRPDARVALHYAVAVGEGGARRHVPPERVANAEVMQAMMTIRRAVSRGEQAKLCREIAARLTYDDRFDAMDAVTIVFGDHRGVAYLVDGVRGRERELARCPIPRPDGPPAARGPR